LFIFSDLFDEYIFTKEFLESQENVQIGDILKTEQKFITSLNAKDPSVGYNR